MNNEKKFIKLTPFKMQVLQSFPFIDEDFDAITNYELLCKVVDYLNKTVLNVDYLNDTVNDYIDKFNELKSYVDNYFDNLDVQEEINNKLDEMAESGELTDIIAQYLGLAGMLTFNTVADMKLAENLVNGSTVETLGYHNYKDGGGARYKVRTITNNDVVDEMTIIALHNNTLVAELLEIDFNKYIDLRWLGADSTGTLDSSSYLLKALELSNENYITPIKIVGHYYLENPINFIGAVSMFGLHTPGTEEFLYTQETTDYTLNSPSEFILNNNITAINLTGIGSTTMNIAVVNIKNIFITEKDKLKTSTFLDVNAFGGPSRPNIIHEVGANGINTLLSAIHYQTTTYTNMMNLDIAGINCYRCGTVLNFPTLSTNNEGIMNLNLHDSIIENSKNIILKSLGVYNQIKSNLFEALSEDSYISIKKASSLEYTGNYFEQNNHDTIFDVYPVYSDNEVTDLGAVEFRDNMTYPQQNTGKFIFNNLSVNAKGYYLSNNLVFKNCILKLDSFQYDAPTLKLEELIKDSTVNFNYIRFKDTIFKTSHDEELSSGNYFYGYSYTTTPYITDGVKTWKLGANVTAQLTTTTVSATAGDYVGILFYKSSENNSSSIALSLLNEGGTGESHIPTATSPYDGYYLYITKVDNTSTLHLYISNRRSNDVYLSPIKVINFGQDLTVDIIDKLSLYV
jgi:hypothetical protein